MDVALGRIVPQATSFLLTSSCTKFRASSTVPSVVKTTRNESSSAARTVINRSKGASNYDLQDTYARTAGVRCWVLGVGSSPLNLLTPNTQDPRPPSRLTENRRTPYVPRLCKTI